MNRIDANVKETANLAGNNTKIGKKKKIDMKNNKKEPENNNATI